MGPTVGIKACDELIIARYILLRISEIHNVQINFDPKPLYNNSYGSGCHLNISTSKTRNKKKGEEHIKNLIEMLRKDHKDHMLIYSKNNKLRLNGRNNVPDHNFTAGIAGRNCSIRIPLITHLNKSGHIEDRRPGGNINPYLLVNTYLDTLDKLEVKQE